MKYNCLTLEKKTILIIQYNFFIYALQNCLETNDSTKSSLVYNLFNKLIFDTFAQFN